MTERKKNNMEQKSKAENELRVKRNEEEKMMEGINKRREERGFCVRAA